MKRTEAITKIRAAMLVLQLEADIMLSAEILEEAIQQFGRETVEDLLYEISNPMVGFDDEINAAKAEIALAPMRLVRNKIKERN